MRPARALALLALAAVGCVNMRLGRPEPVQAPGEFLRVQEIRVNRRVVGHAVADDGLKKIDAKTAVYREFLFEPDEVAGTDGRLGDWILLLLDSGETWPIRPPDLDPSFSVPSFQGRYMAYWALRGGRIVAARVYDIMGRRIVGEAEVRPPIPLDPTDFPSLSPPGWWDRDAVFRHEGWRWIVTAPARGGRPGG